MRLHFSADGSTLEDQGVIIDLDDLYQAQKRGERRKSIAKHICTRKGIRNDEGRKKTR